MEVDIISKNGSPNGTIVLNDAVFGMGVSEGSLYHGLRNERANARQGTASTKGRSEVAYSGRKPWRQKGTGRARAGTRRSPIWVGGGITFGPKPRDYGYTLPRKIKRLAFKSVLTSKLKEGHLRVTENINVTSDKTKDFYSALLPLNPNKKSCVLIVGSHDTLLKRASRNIPWLTVYVYSQLLLSDLVYAKNILLTKSAADKLNTFYTEEHVHVS